MAFWFSLALGLGGLRFGLGLAGVAWRAQPPQVGERVVVATLVVVTLCAHPVALLGMPTLLAIQADAFTLPTRSLAGGGNSGRPVARESSASRAASPVTGHAATRSPASHNRSAPMALRTRTSVMTPPH